ncbi:LuxR C-terminal-related transcriptional regulator [Pseudomonas sp. UBA2684]|uniref:LuxR C-terminal-related transcriptional regulator n=1 Tax=Pseudomonas sp. UBA2684 TaxID=1947311 RepID=UPI000E87A7DE|nr:LuxR C-terminal-related transcriptional regulator [Pseudomonas sp. UBA2684]HBX55194.1 LuxR family transcriptional regulator [Pseudomonas sp.]|tara:strand:- start:13648 stop:16290 length:2643 start_codon:yes stop_codon:yes gene_type:complete
MDSQDPLVTLSRGVLREELLELLGRSEHVPLTLLLAPAGSGKSTLLAHWLARDAHRAVAHYPLQARDNEPVRFFRRLIEHIRGQVADFDTSWFNPFGAELGLSPVAVSGYLSDALARLEAPLYIVLDDFQWISAPTIREVLAALLETLPDNVRLILASRNHPGFSLSRLKLESRLLCIDQHDLRWSAGQIQQLNAHLGGGNLSEAYVSTLIAMTEGWVAGVKVALLAYARFGTSALERFNGTQPEIVDYFGHVVLEQLSPSLREFFLCSALFERFNGAICDHVLQRSGSALLLEELSARQLFMLPVDNQPGWFRYHALLQDFLSSRLAIEKHAMVAALHQRAADYYLGQGEYEPALLHAQRSADEVLFRDLLERGCALWIRTGQFSDILRWLEPLPEGVVLGNSRLLAPLIGALTLSRRFHQAHYYLDALHAQEQEQGAALVTPITRQFLLLQLGLFQHDKDFTPAPGWRELLGPGVGLEVRACTLTVIAYHYLLDAQLQAAIRFAMQSKELLRQSGHSFLQSYTDLIIALCHRNAGRATHARKGVCHDYQHTDTASPAWINRATAMVVVLYEQNQLDEAQQLCEDLMAMVNASSATEAIATVYITLSRLLHRRQQAVRAGRLLDQLSCILQVGNYARFVSQVAQESMRQAYVSGKLGALDAIAQRYCLGERLAAGDWESAQRYDESWERLGLAAVYWLQARGAQGRAGRILKVLATSLRRSEMRARALIVEANLLVLDAPTQSKDQQLAALRRLVEEYGIVNINRSVFDEAPGFGAGVLGLAHAGLLHLPEKYRAFYAEFLQDADIPAYGRVTPVSLLTDKEAEVFECLLSGLSNTQISDKTGIALSTTKWHLKNIYSKLNVSSRTEAILAAHPRAPLA